MTGDPTPRLIAFYLPQYHPTSENTEWWGEGFTDWVNVVRARPLFPGHQQPHLPADLGFYDLRLAASREAQADLARAYGIHGFCYYHYWFGGRRLLSQPLDEVLSSGRPDFPFCVCWANENWTRAWDGQEQNVLLSTVSTPEDDRAHIAWLADVLRDRRYIRVDGKPLLLIYRVSKLADPRGTTSLWREEARRLGIGEIFLASVESLRDDRVDPGHGGFDASVEFQPDWLSLGAPSRITEDGTRIYSYGDIVELMLQKPEPSYRRFPGVTPGWDNTARRLKDATVLGDSRPQLYENWLRKVIGKAKTSAVGEPLVFVNAWNEWAEGAHLEPCQRWGRAYLEATRRALQPGVVTPQVPKRAAEMHEPAIDTLRASPEEQRAALARETAAVAELRTELDRFRRLGGDAATVQADMESLREALRVSQAQMWVLRESFSWRITAPLRALVRRLGGHTTDAALGLRS